MSVGVVTQHLIQLLAKQIEDARLVVWYDPEGHYRPVAASLALPETTVVRYDGSFLRLRRETDPLLTALDPPRLAADGRDAEVEEKSGTAGLRDLLRSACEADLPGTAPLADLRDRLARHVLLTDLVACLGPAVPTSLASAKVAQSPAARDACIAL